MKADGRYMKNENKSGIWFIMNTIISIMGLLTELQTTTQNTLIYIVYGKIWVVFLFNTFMSTTFNLLSVTLIIQSPLKCS